MISQTFIIYLELNGTKYFVSFREGVMSVDFAFLDSGVGGIPYMKHLLEIRPRSSWVYVGDTANFPYGEKTEQQIIENSCNCVKKIIEKWDPSTIVIACNTISVTALEEMRRRFPSTPFVGTVPAIKPAAMISTTRKIGLLATNASISHPYTTKLIWDFANDCQVISRADPDLISFIEHNYFNSTLDQRLNAVEPAVDFFRKSGCDVIVLACTHFLNMSKDFEIAAGSSMKVVDSRDGVVNHAIDVSCHERAADVNVASKAQGECGLYVTGFSQRNDLHSYNDLCRRLDIPFGGLFG